MNDSWGIIKSRQGFIKLIELLKWKIRHIKFDYPLKTLHRRDHILWWPTEVMGTDILKSEYVCKGYAICILKDRLFLQAEMPFPNLALYCMSYLNNYISIKMIHINFRGTILFRIFLFDYLNHIKYCVWK